MDIIDKTFLKKRPLGSIRGIKPTTANMPMKRLDTREQIQKKRITALEAASSSRQKAEQVLNQLSRTKVDWGSWDKVIRQKEKPSEKQPIFMIRSLRAG